MFRGFRMENKKEFKEGVQSYRRRLLDELVMMNSNSSGLVDSEDVFQLRHLIGEFRRSIDKCNLYISSIEQIVEKQYENIRKSDKNSSQKE